MVIDADKTGAKVTASHDSRITRIGSLLRKTKIDELPQLFNVLTGDISLVGPRPEVPYYVSKWSDARKETIFSVKPGITDYATLYYNDEQAVLAKAEDPEKAYLKEVMPHKLRMYEQYVNDQNFWLDIRIILATLLKMVRLGGGKRGL
ncbi:MAG: sugar transferase [Desulfobacterales bacterium]|nr:sugar transferase [Desulfobacterales bacterium]